MLMETHFLCLQKTMAKSKSKKKGKLNSQLYSPMHIDIGDFVDGREDEQIRAPVWRGRCDGEQVRDPLCRGRRDGEQVRAPLWSGRDDELNFDIYMFKYQFLSSDRMSIGMELDHTQVKDLKTTIYLVT
uniref:Uncharacterized protein n=1 Tax=Brassica campestris TaxID=3711 RepID=A0A3P6ATN5_BRACM|nr:unnamed protein product [Brassica rapa]